MQKAKGFNVDEQGGVWLSCVGCWSCGRRVAGLTARVGRVIPALSPPCGKCWKVETMIWGLLYEGTGIDVE